jgi:hypothetical protein
MKPDKTFGDAEIIEEMHMLVPELMGESGGLRRKPWAWPDRSSFACLNPATVVSVVLDKTLTIIQ